MGTQQSAAGWGLEEALIFWVEEVQEREGLASQQEAMPVVEDIMHVMTEEIVVTQASVEDVVDLCLHTATISPYTHVYSHSRCESGRALNTTRKPLLHSEFLGSCVGYRC